MKSVGKTLQSLPSLFISAFKEWSHDKAPSMGAALAYYTVFSLAPLLFLAIGIAGLVLGREAVEGKLFEQLSGLLGKDAAAGIQQMIANVHTQGGSIISTISGIGLLALSASGVFGELKSSLNRIWDVEIKPAAGIWNIIHERFLSFSMVLVITFLLMVSLIASSLINLLGGAINNLLPFSEVALEVINFVISLAIISVLFALIYKVLSDVDIPWKNVWIGAIITALLFTIGKTALGIYIGNNSTASSFGAASSLIILLLWVYYSAQILFFGAEFVKAELEHENITVQPKKQAQFTEERKLLDKKEAEEKSDKVVIEDPVSVFMKSFVDAFSKEMNRK